MIYLILQIIFIIPIIKPKNFIIKNKRQKKEKIKIKNCWVARQVSSKTTKPVAPPSGVGGSRLIATVESSWGVKDYGGSDYDRIKTM